MQPRDGRERGARREGGKGWGWLWRARVSQSSRGKMWKADTQLGEETDLPVHLSEGACNAFVRIFQWRHAKHRGKMRRSIGTGDVVLEISHYLKNGRLDFQGKHVSQCGTAGAPWLFVEQGHEWSRLVVGTDPTAPMKPIRRKQPWN